MANRRDSPFKYENERDRRRRNSSSSNGQERSRVAYEEGLDWAEESDNVYSAGPNRDIESVTRKAALEGLTAFYPKENELLLDFDEPRGTPNVRVLKIIREHISAITSTLMTTSKSGNRHFYLRLERCLPLPVRIALQAALGSDPVREILSIVSDIKIQSTAPSALFETPEQAIRVIRWRASVAKNLEGSMSTALQFKFERIRLGQGRAKSRYPGTAADNI